MALDSLLHDVRYAVRGLLRNPLFALVAVLTMAIGTGANTAVFSVVDGVLLKPLPYPEPDRLVSLWHDAPGAPGLTALTGGLNISPSMFVTYREENRSFEQLGLWAERRGNVTGLAEPEQVPMVLATGGVLDALGVPPLLGRWLTEADEGPEASAVTLLGYDYWQRRFGGARDVLGKTLTVDSTTVEIVGVMPKGFRFGDVEADLIGPYRFDRARLVPPPFCCFAVGRLKPGVTIEQADADAERMLPIWLEKFQFPGGVSGKRVYLDTWRITPAFRSLKADVVGNVGDVLWVVMAMIGIVLVIACANVTNLLLVRGERRAQELGVRAALGAGTWRIARALLAESLLIAAAGGAVGLVLGMAAIELLKFLAPPRLPRLDTIALDLRAFAFAGVLTVAAGVVVSIAPALRGTGGRLSTTLRAGARAASAGRSQHRAQNFLVVGQVALALVLLVTSGLMIRTFEALRSVEPGFAAPETLQTFRVDIPDELAPDPHDALRQQHAILDALAAIPGVSAAGFVTALPMEEGGTNWDGLEVQGQPGPAGEMALRRYTMMSPGYLATMGIRVVAGRDLTWADLDGQRNVVLVSAGLARELWGGAEAALGARVRPPGGTEEQWRDVVGVVDDVRQNGLDRPPPAIVYWPAFLAELYRGQPYYLERDVAIAVRTSRAGSPTLQRELERAVWSVNPSLPLADIRTMENLYDRSLARTSFTLVMLALAAGAALVLGVVGLYGVLSYAVSLRRREIAIRLALGAQRGDVQWRFVRHGLVLAGVGVALGLAAAAGTARLMASLLYDVAVVDPPTYALVAAGLTVVAALASYLPARRASSVDPAESLAAE